MQDTAVDCKYFRDCYTRYWSPSRTSFMGMAGGGGKGGRHQTFDGQIKAGQIIKLRSKSTSNCDSIVVAMMLCCHKKL